MGDKFQQELQALLDKHQPPPDKPHECYVTVKLTRKELFLLTGAVLQAQEVERREYGTSKNWKLLECLIRTLQLQ